MENLSRQKYLKVSGIYAIKSVTKNRIYIGSSKNLYKRINHHIRELEKNKHGNKFLQNHFNKYGKDSLYIEVLEVSNPDITVSDLLILEQKYLSSVYDKNCFNCTNNVVVIRENPKFVELGRKAVKDNWNKNYAKMKAIVTENLKKARESVEILKKEGNFKPAKSFLGKTHSVESRIKMSNSAKLRGRQISTLRTTYQYSLNGEYIASYDSIADACRALNLNNTASANISACMLNKRNKAYGFIWKNSKNDN